MTVVGGARPPIHVHLTWDFGGSETEEDMTLEDLGYLIREGKDDGEGRVTSLVIWVRDALACLYCDHSIEQHGDVQRGTCKALNCVCEEYTKP